MKSFIISAMALALLGTSGVGAASADPRNAVAEARQDLREARQDRRQENQWERRALKRYKAGRYQAPKGYYARRWAKGQRLPIAYRNRMYVVDTTKANDVTASEGALAEHPEDHAAKTLLWQEYREQQPDGVGYSQFCEYCARWLQGVTVVMRQEHRAGEKMFVDFSGDGIEIVSAIGEVLIAKLFVAVLGASNLTYVEAVLREDLATWIGCHVRALAYFGGVPEIAVPDNLKSGVSGVHRYEPEVNRTYGDLAQHYGFVVIPARA
ncbi:MAG: IS21 family transposase, partial [Caulobacteraceae bacterium]|nr:IS21 family transposase [Caulobacteraceae bacterium]